jgi:hypothetical protein
MPLPLDTDAESRGSQSQPEPGRFPAISHLPDGFAYDPPQDSPSFPSNFSISIRANPVVNKSQHTPAGVSLS